MIEKTFIDIEKIYTAYYAVHILHYVYVYMQLVAAE